MYGTLFLSWSSIVYTKTLQCGNFHDPPRLLIESSPSNIWRFVALCYLSQCNNFRNCSEMPVLSFWLGNLNRKRFGYSYSRIVKIGRSSIPLTRLTLKHFCEPDWLLLFNALFVFNLSMWNLPIVYRKLNYIAYNLYITYLSVLHLRAPNTTGSPHKWSDCWCLKFIKECMGNVRSFL